MNKENYYGQVLLPQKAVKNIEWLKRKTQLFIRKTDFSSAKFILTTYASSEGWGSLFKSYSTSGKCIKIKCDYHINEKDLLAIYIGLSTLLLLSIIDTKTLTKSDNLTAVICINKHIWLWILAWKRRMGKIMFQLTDCQEVCLIWQNGCYSQVQKYKENCVS